MMWGREGFDRVMIHKVEGACLLNLGWNGILSNSFHGSGVFGRVGRVRRIFRICLENMLQKVAKGRYMSEREKGKWNAERQKAPTRAACVANISQCPNLAVLAAYITIAD
jgi:hypothetical protein